jgi:hypothetical protein
MIRGITVGLLGWLCLSPMFAMAQTATAYDVEVVVFENNLPDLEGSEIWTTDRFRPTNTTGAVAMGTTPTSSGLSSAVAALQASGGRHRVLFHRRWTQPNDTKEKSPVALLKSEDGTLNGTLRFYVSRFMHLELSADFTPVAASAGQLAPIYQIQEQRRIRSQETHYFDHPKFGVIVRVTPAG